MVRTAILRPQLVLLVVLLAACTGPIGDGANPPSPADAGFLQAVDSGMAVPPLTGTDAGTSSRNDASSVVADAGEGAPGPGHLLWLFDGETGMIGGADERHDGGDLSRCGAHREEALSIGADYPSRAGSYAARVHLEEEWIWGRGLGCAAKIRTLIRAPEDVRMHEGVMHWLGWSLQVPEDWSSAGESYTVMNIHPGPGTGGQVTVSLREDLTRRVHFKSGLGPTVEFGRATPGVWDDFVAQILMTHDDRGRFVLWHRQAHDAEWQLVVEYTGPTMTDIATFPAYPQLGLIQPGGDVWTDRQSSRTLFMDEIRFGGPDSSFEEVAPTSGYALP